MTMHELKISPEYFRVVANEFKKFELCQNDRDFQVGDLLHLREYNPLMGTYSGQEVLARVDYILHGGEFGLAEGFVCMSITVLYVNNNF